MSDSHPMPRSNRRSVSSPEAHRIARQRPIKNLIKSKESLSMTWITSDSADPYALHKWISITIQSTTTLMDKKQLTTRITIIQSLNIMKESLRNVAEDILSRLEEEAVEANKATVVIKVIASQVVINVRIEDVVALATVGEVLTIVSNKEAEVDKTSQSAKIGLKQAAAEVDGANRTKEQKVRVETGLKLLK